MGQAKQKRNSWGSRVVHPLLYVPFRTFWGVAFFDDRDTRVEEFMRGLIRAESRIRRSIPSHFIPERTPFDTVDRDFESMSSEFELKSSVGFNANGGGAFFYEDDFSLVRDSFDMNDISSIMGQPGRYALSTGDAVEVAINEDGDGFVTRDGPIKDLDFFADKMIVVSHGVGHCFSDPLLLQIVAILRDRVTSEEIGNVPFNVEGVTKHMAVFDRITGADLKATPGVEVERVVFRAISEYPEILLDTTLIRNTQDLMPHALHLFKDAYGQLMSQIKDEGSSTDPSIMLGSGT